MKLSGFAIGTILAALLVLAGLVVYIALPLWSSLDETKNAITTHGKTLTDSKQTYTSLRRLAQDSEELASQAQIANQLVPQESRLGDFLIQMEAFLSNQRIAGASFELPGLTASINTTNTQKSSSVLAGAETHSFTIDGQTSLEGIKELINSIKTITRLNEINAVDIVGNTQADSLTFQISGNVFSRKTTAKDQSETFSNKLVTEASTRFAEFKEYGQLIDIEKETGFGRPNPFLPY